MGVGHEQTHARHRRLIYRVDCKTPLSCLLMVNGVNVPPLWPICEQSTTRPSKYLGLSFNRKKFWFWERGANRSRFQTVFCSPPPLCLLWLACLGNSDRTSIAMWEKSFKQRPNVCKESSNHWYQDKGDQLLEYPNSRCGRIKKIWCT